ncbi:YIP1 family protein [Streptomyces sp. NPDC006739]|uniref:Yip1 family protein n=1 Tax=Streptomyces sp. NPDC006739 TaxID=3364763 RepID=UPI003682D9AF
MSQLSSKAGPGAPGPAHDRPGAGTFEDVAGFRIGRGGRDNRAPQGQQAPQAPHTPQGPPYGGGRTPQGPSYGYPPAPQPYPQQRPRYGAGGGAAPWPRADGGYPGQGQVPVGDGPEYFGDYPQDPYAADQPGHTQAFSVDEAGYARSGTYSAGSTAAPGPTGPSLRWKELLRGIVLAPDQTFLRMRDYTMWGPALIVTFLYGLLAVFGFDGARKDAINATLANAVPIVLITAVAMAVSTFVLGVVTHTLARQLGGDGAWQPTVGLSMLITSLTDAPRLVFAMFFGGNAGFVQLLGWATWIAAGALLTLMVSRSHDLPWPKALGACAIQLVALLSIVKLGTF